MQEVMAPARLTTSRGRARLALLIAAGMPPLAAGAVAWGSGGRAEEIGLLLMSAAGSALVGVVGYRLGVTAGSGGRVVGAENDAERDELVAEAREAREAFARSAGIIGEYLYTGELHPDERFAVTTRGPGLAALLGAAERDSQRLLDGYDDFVHPDDREAYDRSWRFADLVCSDGEIVQQEYRLVGLDGGVRWVRDRAAVTVRDDGRVLLTGAACDISAQRRAEDERSEALRRLEWLSSVDALTELFNRRHFSEVLRARLAGSAAGAAIALVDVDHFKRINDLPRPPDRRPRAARDRATAQGRHPSVRRDVALGRRGVLRAARRDRRRGASSRRSWSACAPRSVRQPIPIDADTGVHVTISIGAVRPSPECHTPEQLLASADAALYAAKRGGRNQARIARGAPAARPGGRPPRASRASCRRSPPPPRSAAAWRRCTARRSPRSRRPSPSSSACPPRRWSSPASAAGCTTAARSRCRRTSSPTAARWMRGRARASAITPIAGEALVSVVPGLSDAAQIVRSHHERFDGTGYPDGLAGEDIPLAARIVGAADAFVAMTESRPYEGPRGHGDAVAELQRSAGGQFDPRVVEAMLAVLEHERRGDQVRAG